jgi:HSP20 family protein
MTFFWVSNNEEVNEEVEEIEENEVMGTETIWQIAIDILETSRELVLLAPAAWINLEDIEILLNNNILTIKWIRKKPDIFNLYDIAIRNSECFWWEFRRNIILPENLDFDSVKASLENGILTISIPKLKFSNQSIKIEQK